MIPSNYFKLAIYSRDPVFLDHLAGRAVRRARPDVGWITQYFFTFNRWNVDSASGAWRRLERLAYEVQYLHPSATLQRSVAYPCAALPQVRVVFEDLPEPTRAIYALRDPE